MTELNTILDIQNVKASYGMVQVLYDVGLRVRQGEIVGLVGRNGAGKTTTLKTISGTVPLQGGTIEFKGKSLPRRPHKVARNGVIHVPEGRGLIANMSVIDNIRLGAAAAAKTFDQSIFSLIDTYFPKVARLFKRRAGLLSGGEQQMVALVRGLAADPTLLMVDELSLGLAPKAVAEVTTSLLEASRSKATSLLVVDQNVRAMSKICDELYYLREGVSSKLAPGTETEKSLRSIYFD